MPWMVVAAKIDVAIGAEASVPPEPGPHDPEPVLLTDVAAKLDQLEVAGWSLAVVTHIGDGNVLAFLHRP